MSVPAIRELDPGLLEVLEVLKLSPKDPVARALVAVARRYDLDPLLGQIDVIQGSVYITRDGMLEIAHRSGQLDGIETVEQRRNSTGDGWTAYVSVWRKDMSHPFTYGAQCKDTEPQAKGGLGPEMALARAERRALKRAFAIPIPDADPPPSASSPDWAIPVMPSESPEPIAGPDMPPEGPESLRAHSEGSGEQSEDPVLPGLEADPGEWWSALARDQGVPPGSLVARARRFCQDLSVEPRPREIGDIPTEGPVAEALLAWLAELGEPF